MKKLLLPLSILFAQAAFADDASNMLKKQILDGKTWSGAYGVEYYQEQLNDKNVAEFYYKSTEVAAYEEQDLNMTLSFEAADMGIKYEWDRELRGSGETDDKTCASKEITVKKKKKTVGKTLPRVLVLKQDLLDAVDAKAPAAVVPDVNAAEKAKIEALFAGIKAKLKLRDPVIALIKGKRCSEGVVGEDLNVPVLKIEMSEDGKALNIIASLGIPEGYDNVMGYSVYTLKTK